MKITGAIFDMDGTLLDSMDYWAMAAGDFLRGEGVKITDSDATDKRFLEDGVTAWHSYCVKAYGLKKDLDEVRNDIYLYMNEKYKTVVKLKDGAREMLERLYRHGVKMCLATATDRPTVEAVLKRLGIEKYFPKIFTCGEVGAGKRNPLIYELALEHLGTDKETTYVFEDAHYALKTAHENGFKCVCVYDKNVFASKDEMRTLCDYYLDEGDGYAFEIE